MPDLSIYFFADTVREDAADRYRLLIEATKFADANGFSTVWVPERHFQPFGGLYPSPSVAAAALAAVTKRIRIHAGSVVAPLNDPLRVAEEWAMVDNLSNGRTGIAFASGWHVNDFVLAPDQFEGRKQALFELAETIRRLWKGETVLRKNGAGSAVPTRIYPTPVQPMLPTWITAVFADETFRMAGELGHNILTNCNRKTRDTVASKIRIYRDANRKANRPPGRVTVMAHTFVAETEEELLRVATPALDKYLDVHLELQSERAKGLGGTDAVAEMDDDDRAFLKQRTIRQFIQESGFIVQEKDAAERLAEFAAIGVDEVACLLDFGIPFEDTMKSLARIAKLVTSGATR